MSFNLHLSEAFSLLMRTKAYLVYRAIIFGAVATVIAAGLLVLALIGKIFGGTAAVILLLVALAAGGWGMRLLKEYVLYVLQAGHLALVTELACRGALPPGVSQTAWAKARVNHYFKEVSGLAVIDQLLKGIITALNRQLFNVMTILPIPGMEGLAGFAQKIVDASLTYVDEAIISQTFRTGEENVFQAARQGVLLYCQAWKGLLKNAVALTLLSYAFTIAGTVICLIPLGAVALMLPSSWEVARLLLFGLAFLLGLTGKWILFDPLACTATVLTYLRETEGVNPDAAWEARIASVSDKFQELCARAQGSPAPEEEPVGNVRED